MKRIQTSRADAKTVFDSIGGAMRNGRKHQNATNYVAMRNDVHQQLDEYDQRVNPISLENLVSLWPNRRTNMDEARTAHDMYSTSKNEIKQIRAELETLNGGKVIKCPICELDYYVHLDHYIPREEMPEFSVHPKNLIPLCDYCNTVKSTLWLSHASRRRLIFNCAYDTPSGMMVLECRVTHILNGFPVCVVDYKSGLPANSAVSLECSTYHNLRLRPKYKAEVDTMLKTEMLRVMGEYADNSSLYQSRLDFWNRKKNIYRSMMSIGTTVERLFNDALCNSPILDAWVVNSLLV